MDDPNKLKLVRYLATPKALRNMSLKDFAITQLKVSEPTIHQWKKLPEVQKAVEDLINKRFKDDVPDVLFNLRDRAIAGDVKSAKMFLEFVEGIKFSKLL